MEQIDAAVAVAEATVLVVEAMLVQQAAVLEDLALAFDAPTWEEDAKCREVSSTQLPTSGIFRERRGGVRGLVALGKREETRRQRGTCVEGLVSLRRKGVARDAFGAVLVARVNEVCRSR